MKFFVMLAVLLLRNFPGGWLTRPVDGAFFSWQDWLEQRLNASRGSALVFLGSVLPWVILLWAVLWLLQGVFWSLPSLLLHLLVIFYALGRRNELVWVGRYMVAWRQGDQQAAAYYAQEILGQDVALDPSAEKLHCQVVSRLIYMAFERLFLVLFWYLLLGLVGALLARLSELALGHAQAEKQSVDEQVLLFQQVLEWPAARLTGLTLALVSRPWVALPQFVRDLPRWQMSSEVFLNRILVSGYGLPVDDSGQQDAALCMRPQGMTEEADQELVQLREYVWRMLALWVGLTALAVILFG